MVPINRWSMRPRNLRRFRLVVRPIRKLMHMSVWKSITHYVPLFHIVIKQPHHQVPSPTVILPAVRQRPYHPGCSRQAPYQPGIVPIQTRILIDIQTNIREVPYILHEIRLPMIQRSTILPTCILCSG